MDLVDAAVALAFAIAGCATSLFLLPKKAGITVGFLGLFLVTVQMIYAIATASADVQFTTQELLTLVWSPARFGVALGLMCAGVAHLFRRNRPAPF